MDLNPFVKYFPPALIEKILIMGTENLQEIRLVAGKNCIVQKNGVLYDTKIGLGSGDIRKVVDSMCRGSVFAMQTSLVDGFIPLAGGHRAGVCGRTVTENGKITHMTDISAVCIRISKEVKGASDGIIEYVFYKGKVYNTLIISPPGCGKTTVLRDIARQIGNCLKVCIADERSEIAAMKDNVPSYDVGNYTAVMDGVPKAEGIRMMLRTMAPDVIVTDETGSEEENRAISEIVNCGVKIITTAHGYSEKDVEKRNYIGNLIKGGAFERIIVLSNRCGVATVEKIITDGRVIRHV